MSDAPSLPFGPTLVVAPSAQANNVASMTPTLTALFDLAQRLKARIESLQKLLDVDLPSAAKAFAGAAIAIKAIAGVADAMDDTFPFRTTALVSPPDLGPKVKTLRQRADALVSAFQQKTGGRVNPREFVTALDDGIKSDQTELKSLMRDAANLNIVRDYCADTTLDPIQHYVNLFGFNELLAKASELLARSGDDEADRIAQEVLEQHDDKGSAQAIALGSVKTLWDAFVAVAQTHTSVVGNLPAPDSLSVVLLKVWASNRLIKVATNQAAAQNLGGRIARILVDSVKLTSQQSTKFKEVMDDLTQAQKEVIDRSQALAEATRTLPDDTLGHARIQNQITAAQTDCEAKANRARTFFQDTYGDDNQKIFGNFQRGLFMDGFVTVMTLIQFAAAMHELGDPSVSLGQKVLDTASTSILGLGAIVATVGRTSAGTVQINLGVAKFNLATAGKFAEDMGTKIAGICAVLQILSGANQVIQGIDDNNTEEKVVGALNVFSGSMILLGACLASAALTVVGVGIGTLLAAYALGQLIADSLKSPTEKAISGLLDGLEKTKVYTSKTAIQHLGLDAQLKEIRDAVSGACFQIVRNPNGSPTRDNMIGRMMNLGFRDQDARSLVETDQDEQLRVTPPLVI